MRWSSFGKTVLPLLVTSGVVSHPAIAQIVPAIDGTGTLVTPNGTQSDITGGTRSADNANLFHSFQQFGLGQGQTANFIADPQLQNILSRITGGSPSTIDGLLQITGGTPNLYLLNPAGIIFGPNASLNIPASFTATTATGLGFGSNTWGITTEANSVANLLGNPTSFNFATSTIGTIVNAGDLAVTPGSSLNFLAGTIVNTGSLTAPNGSITLTTVPGSSLVRLSQPGSLLSLEITPPTAPSSSLPIAAPLTLPQLLTGSGLTSSATGLAVDPDGTVRLVAAGTVIPETPGTTIVAGSLSVAQPEGSGVQFSSGNTAQINILGDRVGLFGADVNASGPNGGGTVLIGGDYQGQGTTPTASRTLVSGDSQIRADALQTGNGGRVILWANDFTAFAGNISARGGALGGNGGFVEVSGKQALSFTGLVDLSAPLGQVGSLLLDPTNITIVPATTGPTYNGPFNFDFTQDAGSDYTIIDTVLTSQTAAIRLEASNNITIDPSLTFLFFIASPGNNIAFIADADGNGTGSFVADANTTIATNGRNLSISGANVTTGDIVTDDNSGFITGALTLTATNGNIQAGVLNTSSDFTLTGGTGNGAALTLTATGNIQTGAVGANSRAFDGSTGNGGNITMTAGGNILVNNGLSSSSEVFVFSSSGTGTGNAGNGGIITLTAGGSITYAISSEDSGIEARSASEIGAAGNGGTVNITANNNISIGGGITTNTTSSVNTTGNAGPISLTSTNGNIITTGSLTATSQTGNGGAIELLASGNISVSGSFRSSSQTFGVGGNAGNAGLINLRAGGDITFSGFGFEIDATSFSFTGTAGNGGDVTLNAGGGILVSSGFGYGIETTSTSSAGTAGNGGAVTVTAGTNIDLGSSSFGFGVNTRASGSGTTGNAGPITLTATNGNLTTGALSATSRTGSGGAVNLTAGGANHVITIGNDGSSTAGIPSLSIDTRSSAGTGGNITLTGDEVNFSGQLVSGGGALLIQPSTPAQGINLFDTVDTAGLDVTVDKFNLIANSFSSVTIGRNNGSGPIVIQPFTFSLGSPLTIQSPSGSLTSTGNLTNNFPGSLTLLGGTANLGNVITNGGNVSITSTLGNLTVGSISTTPQFTGGGGNVSLTAVGNLVATGIIQSGLDGTRFAFGNGGNVSITSTNGSVQLAEVNTGIAGTLSTNPNDPSGVPTSPSNGGQQQITAAGNLTTGNLTSGLAVTGLTGNGGPIVLTSTNGVVQAGNISSNNQATGNGGAVTVNAAQAIQTGEIDTSATTGNAGNVTLDPPGLTQVSFINTQARQGIGGNVNINANNNINNVGLFRSTSSFTALDGTIASISTQGSAGGGSVTIQHGGSITTPFIIGNGATNGTAAAITTSSDRINPTFVVPVPPAIFQRGNIRIITTTPTPPDLPPSVETPPGGGNTPDGPIDNPRPDTDQNDDPIRYNPVRHDYAPIESGPSFPIFETADQKLQRLEKETGKKPAIIYVSFFPDGGLSATDTTLPAVDDRFTANFAPVAQGSPISQGLPLGQDSQVQANKAKLAQQAGQPKPSDRLELVLIIPNQRPIRKTLSVTREQVTTAALAMRGGVTDTGTNDYLKPSQQLYQWIVAPLEADLKEKKIDTLLFSMDEGLRTLPVAALHNGQNFVIQDYSVGMTPSFNLTDTRYRDIKQVSALGMGASTFKELNPLPAVPIELTILENFWRSQTFLNQKFTIDNLRAQRNNTPYGIIHLATHAEFQPNQAFIQLWNDRLQTDQIRALGWNNPPVELLVLSACRTAVGNSDVELGFAGMAVQAGVKSVLASLWYVSDEGTMALMSEFYQQLGQAEVTIKAEALRQAQLAMLSGTARPNEKGQLGSGKNQITLPPELAARMSNTDLSHPYYWSAFTMVGSPW